MIGYTFVFGVDGFGADTAPAYEEGVFLSYEKAFAHFKTLTQKRLEMTGRKFYEEGYGEDYWPNEDLELESLWNELQENDFDEKLMEKFDKMMDAHVLHDIDAICNHINNHPDGPPIDFYQMVEVEIIE